MTSPLGDPESELDDEGADGLARRYAASGATIAQIAATVRAMGPIGMDALVAELELRVGLGPPAQSTSKRS